MKYVIVKTESGLECPIIFPDAVVHAQVARGRNVVAAGFCDGYQAYGKSESLGIGSRPEQDTKILEYFFNGKY